MQVLDDDLIVKDKKKKKKNKNEKCEEEVFEIIAILEDLYS